LAAGSSGDPFERQADEVARPVIETVERPGFGRRDETVDRRRLPTRGTRIQRSPAARPQPMTQDTSLTERAIGPARSKIELMTGHQLLGSVTVRDVDDATCEATDLSVEREHRGEGYGAELIGAVARAGAKLGRSRVTLGAQDDGSGRLDHWYESLGFNATGTQGDGFTRYAAPTTALRTSRLQRAAVVPRTSDTSHAEPCNDRSSEQTTIRRMETSTPAQELAELMIKSGSLGDLDGGRLVDLWPQLSVALTAAVADIEQNHQLVAQLGYMPCGVLLVTPGRCEMRPDVYGTTGDLTAQVKQELAEFVLSFMQANGQMAFIERQSWYIDNTHEVAIDINFYPDRALAVGGLGLHKDTAGENLFVNLIFNNVDATPATEWTEDTHLPDAERLAKLRQLLPPELVDQLIQAKAIIEQISSAEKGTFRGGLSGANAWVSFVDELIWHSSPSLVNRPTFDAVSVLEGFAQHPESGETYEAMVVVSQTPGNSLFDQYGGAPQNLTPEKWKAFHEQLIQDSGKAAAFGQFIRTFDWSAHKQTGATGAVLVGPESHELVNVPKPTMAQGRPRANSDAETLGQVNAAAPQGTKRTFIRTWVRIVPAGKTK
jgi:ribosomal protein S18 acetylase RimI-like enzyme